MLKAKITQNFTGCFGVSPFCYTFKNDHSLEGQNMRYFSYLYKKACTYVLACMIPHLHLHVCFLCGEIDRHDICRNHPVFKVYIVSIE